MSKKRPFCWDRAHRGQAPAKHMIIYTDILRSRQPNESLVDSA